MYAYLGRKKIDGLKRYYNGYLQEDGKDVTERRRNRSHGTERGLNEEDSVDGVTYKSGV